MDPSLLMGLAGLLGQGGFQGQKVNDPAMTDKLLAAPNQQGAVTIGQATQNAQAQPNPMALQLMMQGLKGMGQQHNAPVANPAQIRTGMGNGAALQMPLAAPLAAAYRDRFMGGF